MRTNGTRTWPTNYRLCAAEPVASLLADHLPLRPAVMLLDYFAAGDRMALQPLERTSEFWEITEAAAALLQRRGADPTVRAALADPTVRAALADEPDPVAAAPSDREGLLHG